MTPFVRRTLSQNRTKHHPRTGEGAGTALHGSRDAAAPNMFRQAGSTRIISQNGMMASYGSFKIMRARPRTRAIRPLPLKEAACPKPFLPSHDIASLQPVQSPP